MKFQFFQLLSPFVSLQSDIETVFFFVCFVLLHSSSLVFCSIYFSSLQKFSSLMIALQLTHTLGQLLYRRFEVFHLLSQWLHLLGEKDTQTKLWCDGLCLIYTHIAESANIRCPGCSRGIDFQANDQNCGRISWAIKTVKFKETFRERQHTESLVDKEFRCFASVTTMWVKYLYFKSPDALSLKCPYGIKCKIPLCVIFLTFTVHTPPLHRFERVWTLIAAWYWALNVSPCCCPVGSQQKQSWSSRGSCELWTPCFWWL